MNGGGNETEISLKYVHTYQNAQASVSINTSGTFGFSVSGVDKQWSISCAMYGLPY